MTAPRRLLDGSLTARERRALSAGRGMAPSRTARARMWKGIDAGLALAGVLSVSEAAASEVASGAAKWAQGAAPQKLAAGASTSTQLALGGKASVALAKLLLTWSLVGGGLGLGVKLAVSEDAPWRSSPSALRATPSKGATPISKQATPGSVGKAHPQHSRETEASQVGRAQPDLSTAPSPPELTPRTSFAAKTKSGAGAGSLAHAGADERALEEESALLAQARAHLHDGDVESCLGILLRAERRYPSSVLSQEREALRIEALARAGQRERARRLADDFSERHPESPHVDRVRELAR